MNEQDFMDQHPSFAYAVFHAAQDVFDSAGCSSDFGIQTSGEDYVIFGGVNRVKWTVKNGFLASKSHCTPSFLEHFVAHFGERFF